jgi:ribonuclease HII
VNRKKQVELAPSLVAGRIEMGCDEAGRGCLAGPVVAAAVCLTDEVGMDLVQSYDLNDSKKLSRAQRNSLRELVEDRASAWAVSFVSPQEIDEINILQASFLGMRRAANALIAGGLPAEHLLIDGNRFRTAPGLPPHTCMIKGDARFASIAAASVLAKTHRDNYMENLAIRHPEYGWQTNAGYPTAAHREAIRTHGLTVHHRMTFQQLPIQSDLFSTN